MAKGKVGKTTTEQPLEVLELQKGRVSFCIKSLTPLIYNAVSFKTMAELLIPHGRKTAVERQGTLKHIPMEEYFNSTYRHRGDSLPTRLMFPGGGFKKAMMEAALRMPGMRKTETGQLLWVEERDVSIWGVPQIYLAVVRSADMNRTPDVRTRAIVPAWAARVTFSYIKPQFSHKQVAALFAAAGLLCGIGDGRQQKGYGNGQFEICNEDDPAFTSLCINAGRTVQDAALESPVPYDVESENLLAYYDTKVEQMGDRIVRKTKTRAADEHESAGDEANPA